MDFYKRIAQNAQRLNKSDNEILSYCVRNNQKISGMKVQEVAQELYTSPASMIRFCKKLGFSGFSEFKAALRLELSGRQDRGEKENESVDFLKDVHKTLQLVQEDTVDRILELIHKSRQVEIYAAGSSRMVASEFVKRLQIIGKPAFCYDDSSLMNISARQVTGEDLVIIISASGETSLMIAAANTAKSRGAAIVSVTNLGSNTLSEMADENVYANSTCFMQSGIQIYSRAQLLLVCEYIFFRYLECYGK
ncbi:MAG: MurR/RpiR family transcriptional regulator [Lachnospiraceae bacterium]|jgi:DNA-binding MurR/RpiR family transcriptional regulator|nr:MurR/RpiR family transcriptional regulator [Lachnospiraceae bacterium]MCI8960718.1 MurR/RpiR family transcriptional regulator [Lachnospiraceae bacterium]